MHIQKFQFPLHVLFIPIHSVFGGLIDVLPDCFVLLQLLLPRFADISGICILCHCRLIFPEPPLWSSTNCINNGQQLLNHWRAVHILFMCPVMNTILK